MILYHITSLEKPIQSILIPKIPDETEIGENYTEKRICLAPSILECLKSAEIVNKFDDEVGLVRVYKVKINEDVQIWSVGINYMKKDLCQMQH